MSDSNDQQIRDMIGANPLVDEEQFDEAQALLATLRPEGLEKPTYGIGSPYQRGQIQGPTRGASHPGSAPA